MRTLKLIYKTILPGIVLLVFGQQARAQTSRPTGLDEQRFEFGGGIGGSFGTSKSITGSGGTADAFLPRGLAGSIWLGHNMYRLVGGEFRYDLETGDYKLKGSGQEVSFGGRSHSVHYDVHVHFSPLGSKLRPYVLAGVGVKRYSGTGAERAFQPLSRVAVLSATNELKAMMTFGAGLKLSIGRNLNLRLEFRDTMTPFPGKIILPTTGGNPGGWVHDLTPLVGLSYVF